MLPDEEQGVQAGSPPVPTEDSTGGASPASGVTDVAPPTDRTWREVSGELERKFNAGQTRVERQIAELAALIAQQHQRPQPATTQQEYSDEQLSQLASAGNAEAHRLLTERYAQRYAQVNQQYAQEQALVNQELATLVQRYPALNDVSSPLRQSAEQAFRLLRGIGRPDDQRTRVDAILRAVADQGAQPVTQHTVPGRSVPASAALDGSVPRRQPPPQNASNKPMGKRELEIAARMGLTPERARQAKANFEKRNAAGRSNITPGVAQLLEGQE